MAYQGMILDFGGVITTDFYGCLAAFCVREGLAPDSVTRVHFTGAPSDFAEIERLIGIA